MNRREVHYLDLTEIARRIRAKEISPVELTNAMLRRIENLDSKLHAYALVMADSALAQAKKAEAEIMQGHIRGVLHGVPVAVKDNCWTKDIVTTNGMTIYQNHKPTDDSTIVKRLHDAGSVLLGKLQLTEGAFAEHHSKITPPVNPWHKDHWPGASSSGSGVATAAGLCYASNGTDTLGSIRFPCAANGLTGIKPTWGRVSRHGVFANSPSMDHVGPMARSAVGAGAVLGVFSGPDDKDPTASLVPVPNYLAMLERGLRGVRIGVDGQYNSRDVDAETVRTVNDALKVFGDLGADVREVTFPNPDQTVADAMVHSAIEMATAHEATYPSRQKDYGRALTNLIELGRQQSVLEFQKILMRRHEFRGLVNALFESIDLLVIPAQSIASPTLKRMEVFGEKLEALYPFIRFTCPFDMTGNPAITMPGGFTDQGTPIAFQLVGRHMEEDLLVRAGHAFQKSTDWHSRTPPEV